jgi:signal transduction histidine kinase
MTPINKVVFLVGLNLALITASFVTLMVLETTEESFGNSINVASKTRFLTLTLDNQIHLFVNEEKDPAPVFTSLVNLEKNLQLLKNGGLESGENVKPLPEKFNNSWQNIWLKFKEHELIIQDVMVQSTVGPITNLDKTRIAFNSNQLFEFSDELTKDLVKYSHDIKREFIVVEIILAIVNVAALIILVLTITKIIRKDAEEHIKQQKFATVGEASSKLIHDLKNPLTVIKTDVSLIQARNEKFFSKKDTEQFARINRAIDNIVFQISDVLDHIKGKPIKLETISLNDLLSDAFEMIKLPANIKVTYTSNDTAKIECDQNMIQTVFTNILKNAAESIGNNDGEITISITDKGDSVVCSIHDSGPEISSEIISKIFDMLYTTKSQGTGLGLSNCKSIIEKHGGEIQAHNNPKRFTIKLPKKFGGMISSLPKI